MKVTRMGVTLALVTFAQIGKTDPLDAWTNRTSKTTAWLKGVAYGNNQFVVVGEQGPDPSDDAAIVTSPDGVTWTDRSPGTAPYASSIAFGNGRFAAVGETILTSPDGITWASSTPAQGRRLWEPPICRRR